MRPLLIFENVLPVFNFDNVRRYSKDKPKRSGPKKIELREDILENYFNLEKLKREMQDIVIQMQQQIIETISIRSAAGAIETLPIEYEGKQYIIQDFAQVNRRNPKVIVLNFSAFPQTIPTVLDALRKSNMNLNPQQDGTIVSIPIPKVTREHREKLAKAVNGLFTKHKQEVKSIENKYMKKLEIRDEKISAEQYRIIQVQMFVLGEYYIEQLEKMKNEKINDLLGND